MMSAEMPPPMASDTHDAASVGAAITSTTDTSADSDTSTVTKMRAELRPRVSPDAIATVRRLSR